MQLLLIYRLCTYLCLDLVELFPEFGVFASSRRCHHRIILLYLSKHHLSLFVQLSEPCEITLEHFLIEIVFIILGIPSTLNLQFTLLLNELMDEGSGEALVQERTRTILLALALDEPSPVPLVV